MTALTLVYAPSTQETKTKTKTKTITITRTGTEDVFNLAVDIRGMNALAFTITQPVACFKYTLSPRGYRRVTTSFSSPQGTLVLLHCRFIKCYMFPWIGHVETCVLLYHKDYAIGEKGKKVTVEVGMNK